MAVQTANEVALWMVSIIIMSLIQGCVIFLITFFTISRLKRLTSPSRHLLWFFSICSFAGLSFLTILCAYFILDLIRIPFKMRAVYEVFSYSFLPGNDFPEPTRFSIETLRALYLPNALSHLHWSVWVLIFWAAGVVLSLLHILIGMVGLLRLKVQKGDSRRDQNLTRELDIRSGEVGLHRKILVRRNERCAVPFTFFAFKPVILLPMRADTWSSKRLQAVLIHELAHIKRRDYLTKFVSRIICALFWFVPPVWIAYRNLQMEQENACDSFVIDSGERPADYAAHIIDIVKRSEGHIILAGIHNSMGKRNLLERRVRNILDQKAVEPVGLKNRLSRSIVVSCVCLIPLLIVNPLIAGMFLNANKAATEEELYGRWFNIEYPEDCVCIPQKVIVESGRVHKYPKQESPEYSYTGEHGRYTVVEKWVDWKGNSWYRVDYHSLVGINYELWKVSGFGTVLESVSDPFNYPEKIDATASDYRVYYRS